MPLQTDIALYSSSLKPWPSQTQLPEAPQSPIPRPFMKKVMVMVLASKLGLTSSFGAEFSVSEPGGWLKTAGVTLSFRR